MLLVLDEGQAKKDLEIVPAHDLAHSEVGQRFINWGYLK